MKLCLNFKIYDDSQLIETKNQLIETNKKKKEKIFAFLKNKFVKKKENYKIDYPFYE